MASNVMLGNTVANLPQSSGWKLFVREVFVAVEDITHIRMGIMSQGIGRDGLVGPTSSSSLTWTSVAIEWSESGLGPSNPQNTTGHPTHLFSFDGSQSKSGVGYRDVTISDELELPFTIPAGSSYAVWGHATLGVGSTGNGVPYRANTREPGDFYAAYNSATSDTVAIGTVPNFSGATHKPCCFFPINTRRTGDSLIGVGDSHFHANIELNRQHNYQRHGFFKQVPMDDTALIVFGIKGIAAVTGGAGSWRTQSQFWKLLQYASAFFCNLGYNEDSLNAAYRTEMNYLASLATRATKKFIFTIGPSVGYSMAHKGWTQVAGQSASASWATKQDAFNETYARPLHPDVGNYTHCMDWALALCPLGTGRSGLLKVSAVGQELALSFALASNTMTAVGAGFTAALDEYGYNYSTAAVGSPLTAHSWVGAVTSADTFTQQSGNSAADASGSPGVLHVGVYTKDGLHITQPMHDLEVIPALGLDDPATWARAA
jgi:hypothetical protein